MLCTNRMAGEAVTILHADGLGRKILHDIVLVAGNLPRNVTDKT